LPTLPPVAAPLRFALGAGLLLAIGLAAVFAARGLGVARRGGGWRAALAGLIEDAALAAAVGPALAVPLLAAAALAGLPLRGLPTSLLLALLLAALAAAAAAAFVARRRRAGAATAAAPLAAAAPAPSGLLWAGRLTLAAALGLAVAKLFSVRLWSWDHFAIWGYKARLFAAGGVLDAELLAGLDPMRTMTDYPLGVPLAWVAATLGALPAPAVVATVHAAWLAALVALVHAAARRLAGSAPVALAAAAFVAVSPLAWDSTHLGLADLPLALFAVAAVAAVAGSPAPTTAAPALAVPAASAPGSWALAGLCVGFLPWTKTEGAPLAVLLAAALAAWRWRSGSRGRRRDLAALALPAAVLGGTALAIQRLLLPRAKSFFDGDLPARLGARLAEPATVLAPIGADLAAAEWLGAWLALLVVLFVAARRSPPALLLGGVVALQLAFYVAVFFATFIDVADHVATALHRIAAALLPLAALAAAALAAPADAQPLLSRRTP
jgi:hypothetical protein